MDKEKLQGVLEDHKRWLIGEGGERADLSDADLRYADLRGANLWGANLDGAVIENTYLAFRTCRFVSDAVSIFKELLSGKTPQELNLFIPDPRAAVVFFANRSGGGFCLVPKREEIWHWNWHCPNPETVTVLWRREDENG
jgi:hypothetical protein